MRLSFRTKLFAALLGLLLPILVLILISVNNTTDAQVAAFTTSSTARSSVAFKEAEDRNREVLIDLGRRFVAPRIVALVHGARMELDTGFIAQNLRYDLELAARDSALVAFTDIEGNALAGVVDTHALEDPATAVPQDLLDSLFTGPDTTAFGYKLIGDRLYSVYMSLLRLVDMPTGFVIVGQAIDASMAENLGRAVEGEVCFVAGGRCVAATSTMEANGMPASEMVAATTAGVRTIDGRRWLFISNELKGGAARRVIARPMDAVLQPFDDIKRILFRVGLMALLLAPFFAILLARGLARPVRALVAATSRVAKGDYSAHVPVTSHDEFGALSVAFNDMTSGLRLKEQYRGLLDKVVSPEIAHEMLSAGVALGGENREVTILFADIRGFTPFTEGMEPQEVIAILNETMEMASAIVEREGGVVDKYIGDEIMALFGAPVSAPDDALRAVRAAIGIRDAMAALAEQRSAHGERQLALGIGVNTGVVVAGNMGSERRLNYTVLGEAVNVAARLCSAAQPQEILVGESTYAIVSDDVVATPAGSRVLKGLSRAMATYAIEGLVTPATSGATVLRSAAFVAFFAACAAGIDVGDVNAQRTQLASYASADGTYQASLGVRADLTAYVPQDASPWLIRETDPFLAPRLSAYVETFAGRHWYGLAELRVDRGEAPAAGSMQFRIEQLFARYRTGARLELQAGKFVSPFGSYPQRHGTVSDPFIRAPLPYEWPTLVTPGAVASSTNDFIDWRDEPGVWRPIGAPPIWGVPYQLGGMAFGTVSDASYRIAIMNSSPSSIPREWDRLEDLWEHPSFVAALAYQFTPALRAGASVNHGPYMRERIENGALAAGRDRNDYQQTIAGIEATYAHRLVDLRGEFFVDQWDVPFVRGTPTDYSYYVEGRVKVTPGGFAALRLARMEFNELDWEIAGDGLTFRKEPWDYPVTRVQLGGGYQITETFSLRAEYQWTRKSLPAELRDNLFSIQLRIDP